MNPTALAIIDAAESRIKNAGYDGFSFREIAADVGVKSASVHYHFPTKENLAAAVARRYGERFLAEIEKEVAGGSDITAAWVATFRKAMHSDSRMCLCGALGATSASLPPEVLAEARRFFENGVQTLIDGGVSRAEAMHVIATLEGAMLLANVLGTTSAFDEASRGLA
ncbi:TetR/AcrR family transcriptional regulator [Tropicimonas isoalkanivorans]|uniref:Transcriptional regulator, TetR family n=1 Tax=Tropicimonas isoalkanivorans TaxID=441112 RepID=A0A1I1MVW9_9RHOB|nr:TetR/AcrR family transcriptional regulator [Tropicimonas isoalkanivorans]SFC86713.1 transcriptional regulator, TetR family [Tropicimonas isoalkanivorans]